MRQPYDVTIVDGDDGIFFVINAQYGNGGMIVFRFRTRTDVD